MPPNNTNTNKKRLTDDGKGTNIWWLSFFLLALLSVNKGFLNVSFRAHSFVRPNYLIELLLQQKPYVPIRLSISSINYCYQKIISIIDSSCVAVASLFLY